MAPRCGLPLDAKCYRSLFLCISLLSFGWPLLRQGFHDRTTYSISWSCPGFLVIPAKFYVKNSLRSCANVIRQCGCGTQVNCVFVVMCGMGKVSFLEYRLWLERCLTKRKLKSLPSSDSDSGWIITQVSHSTRCSLWTFPKTLKLQVRKE